MTRSPIPAVILLSIVALFPFSLHAEPTEKMVPKIHRSGDEGYFSVTFPLPKNAPADRLAVIPQVRGGDIYLLQVTQQGQDAGTDIIVTGRYGRPGKAKITVRARSSVVWTAMPEPLITVVLDLPGGEIRDSSVMKAWANLQRRR